MTNFADRFKRLREQNNLTQDAIAEKLGVSRPTIAGYESTDKNRIPREETLHKIADLFKVSIDFLLGRTEDPAIEQVTTLPDSANPKDKRDFKKFLEQQEVMFDGVPLTNEEKARVLGYMESMFWDAKKLNKRKKPTDSNK